MGKKVLLLVCFMAMGSYLGNKVYADEHKPEGNGAVSDNRSHKYIGVGKCKICHTSEAKGSQYKHWLESKHAKAYEDLASEDAKKTAEKAGLKSDPQKAPECLKCHVTAFGVKDDLKEESFNTADGVQCESCHGAGGDYKSLSVMKDRQKAIKAGLIIPTKEVCIKCHNKESPNYKEFNFDESYKKIAHPTPES